MNPSPGPEKIIGTFDVSGEDCTIKFSLKITYQGGQATVEFQGDVTGSGSTPANERQERKSGTKNCGEATCKAKVQPKTGETWSSVNAVEDFEVEVV